MHQSTKSRFSALPLALALVAGGPATVSIGQVSARADEPAAKEAAKPQPPKVGETAPDFTLNELKGEAITLSKVAESGPVVLVVLRGYPGYQCPACSAQVAELLNAQERLDAAKARVVLVYPGPTDDLKGHANEFVRGKTLPANFYLLLDPDYKFTNAYGLRWDAKNETAYPSTFVLDTARKVHFAKISRTHGGRATTDEVFTGLKAATAHP